MPKESSSPSISILGHKDSAAKIKDRLTNDKNGQLPTS